MGSHWLGKERWQQKPENTKKNLLVLLDNIAYHLPGLVPSLRFWCLSTHTCKLQSTLPTELRQVANEFLQGRRFLQTSVECSDCKTKTKHSCCSHFPGPRFTSGYFSHLFQVTKLYNQYYSKLFTYNQNSSLGDVKFTLQFEGRPITEQLKGELSPFPL